MAPRKASSHTKNQIRKAKAAKLRRDLKQLDINEDPVEDAPQLAQTFPPETIQNTSDLPVLDRYEAIEKEEREAIAKQHKAKVANSIYFNQDLPVRVHVSVPQNGRITREVETTIGECRNIELVVDLVKNSLVFELERAGIDSDRTRFAGLMAYGPTNDFSKDNIIHHTRGLFLDDITYKKWWLGVARTARTDGDMLQIAVVLWDEVEAAKRGRKLPPFWSQAKNKSLGSMLKKLEWNIEEKQLEIGCRSYAKMQEQVAEARNAAAATPGGEDKAEKKYLQGMAAKAQAKAAKAEAEAAVAKFRLNEAMEAMQRNDMEAMRSLVAEWAREPRRRRLAIEVDEDESEEDVESNDDDDDIDDDSDYVEDN